ncbi:MAG TPA: carbon-nitrogen hydrolase family protein [Puia sp.]|nr:carbon-nitrogen hydrolase family protein [Puia sp.]
MKICLAQIKPTSGDIAYNLARHEKFISQAIQEKADLVVFPELSLTGYEPTMAKELATSVDDIRLDGLQKVSDENKIIICFGLPVHSNQGIFIGMVIIQPNMRRELYSKKYLHPDEEPFFLPGINNKIGIVYHNTTIAFAICYELSIQEHSIHAFQSGANYYLASVAKTANGVDRASDTLAEIANKNSALVMMVNCVGFCDAVVCAGRSSVWNRRGELIGQLNEVDEGLLLVDTDAMIVNLKIFSPITFEIS